MVDALGQLIFEKLLFAACVGPVLCVTLQTPAMRAAREWTFRKVFLKPSYTVLYCHCACVLGAVSDR